MKGPPRIFDRKALALHRERARRLGGYSYLGVDAAESIGGRLGMIRRQFADVLDLDGYYRNRAPLARPRVHKDLDENETFDAPPESFDLILSLLGLHTVNDLPGVLIQARRALKPDGLFLAALFGGETLSELRQSLAAAEIEISGGVSPRVAPFADVRVLGGLLQRAGFALPVADVERTVVRYSDFSSLVRDLRAMGETNALAERSRKPISRALLAAAAAHYAANFSDPDGRLRATFDIVYLTGWAPHESQQKPLVPGSAKSRLADALGTDERSAGEPAPRKR
jgi:SAM-dependent methyltransferase